MTKGFSKDIKLIAQTQANEHAEFLGEYTKYIYKHAHLHGFKHGFEYALEKSTDLSFINAAKILAKSLKEDYHDSTSGGHKSVD